MISPFSTLDAIINWGTALQPGQLNHELLLMKQLADALQFYFSTDDLFDDREYPDSPQIDPAFIQANVVGNFPDFGYYNIPTDISVNVPNTKLSLGDPVDDLVDIILDFQEVIWLSENTSFENAVWQFRFGFTGHWGKHLVDLQYYLYHKNANI